MDIRLLEQAAHSGNSDAQHALGTMFLMGEGVPQDAERAFKFFEQAAEKSDSRAQCNLGAMYAQGIGVTQDYSEARRWYELSASQGNSDGQYNLAVVYAQGLGGCRKSLRKAKDLCELAAAQGQEKAIQLLKTMNASRTEASASSSSAPNTKGKAMKASPKSQAQPDAAAGPAASPLSASKAPTSHHSWPSTGREGLSFNHKDSGSIEPHEPSPKDNVASPRAVPTPMSKCREVQFADAKTVKLKGEDGTSWQGEESEVRFPKPGTKDRFRKAFLLKGLASEEEVAGILNIAQNSLDFNVDADSVDQRPTYERYVVQVGQYIHAAFEPLLRPIIENRLMPYVRRRYNMPEAAICTALVRRYLPDERRLHPTHLDGHAFCTAVLGLNAGEFDGGLYVQPYADARQREFVRLERGDLVVHQYDLPHGVRVFGGRRYSLIFWIKDCVHSCVTNSTPWYEAAAAQGDADAITALAQKLNRGMGRGGVGSDPKRAAQLFLRAAELGQPEAQTHLGIFYESGLGGLPEDGAQTVRWWGLAAEAGDSTAQRLLGLAYSNGSCGLARDDAEAVRWMTQAAEHEDWDAMFWLSACYAEGFGVPVDRARAQDWLNRAAEMGHPEAQYGLASSYLSGDGLEQDLALAALWFRRAACNGNASAQCNVGAFYAQGLGDLDQDLRQALHWYSASAEQGNPDGQHNLALMYAQGLGGLSPDAAKAREWCSKAAAQGQAKAIAMLKTLPPVIEEIEEPPGPRNPQAGSKQGVKQESSQFAQKIAQARQLLAEAQQLNAPSVAAGDFLGSLMTRLDILEAELLPTCPAVVSRSVSGNSERGDIPVAPSAATAKVSSSLSELDRFEMVD